MTKNDKGTLLGFAYLVFYIVSIYLCIRAINEPNTALVIVGIVIIVVVNFICLRKAIKWVVKLLDNIKDII